VKNSYLFSGITLPKFETLAKLRQILTESPPLSLSCCKHPHF